jgi:hypothetical protein
MSTVEHQGHSAPQSISCLRRVTCFGFAGAIRARYRESTATKLDKIAQVVVRWKPEANCAIWGADSESDL